MAIALVVGGAECVWKDAHTALSMFTPDAVFIINDMIPRWPGRIDYAVTLHPNKLDEWLRDRKKFNGQVNFRIYAHKQYHGLVHTVIPDWQGSSGLFAVKAALSESFAGVVLAGVPMTPKSGHFVRHKIWSSSALFTKGWVNHYKEIKVQTRSMSGWTKELLGVPTPEWLVSMNSAPPDHIMVQTILEKANGQDTSSPRVT